MNWVVVVSSNGSTLVLEITPLGTIGVDNGLEISRPTLSNRPWIYFSRSRNNAKLTFSLVFPRNNLGYQDLWKEKPCEANEQSP